MPPFLFPRWPVQLRLGQAAVTYSPPSCLKPNLGCLRVVAELRFHGTKQGGFLPDPAGHRTLVPGLPAFPSPRSHLLGLGLRFAKGRTPWGLLVKGLRTWHLQVTVRGSDLEPLV